MQKIEYITRMDKDAECLYGEAYIGKYHLYFEYDISSGGIILFHISDGKLSDKIINDSLYKECSKNEYQELMAKIREMAAQYINGHKDLYDKKRKRWFNQRAGRTEIDNYRKKIDV